MRDGLSARTRALLLLACVAAGPASAADPAADPAWFVPAGASVDRGHGVVVGTFAAAPGSGLPPQAGACFRCHGMNGAGDAAAVFPRLAGMSYAYLYKSLRDYASGARKNAVMTPIAKALADGQMRDVAAYYAAQQAPFGPPPAVRNVRLLQYGASIAAIGQAGAGVQGCINCHGPEGSGLAPSYPPLAGQHQRYLAAQLRGWKRGERRGDALGVMADIARRLTDREIRAVSLYYARIRPAAGRVARQGTQPGSVQGGDGPDSSGE